MNVILVTLEKTTASEIYKDAAHGDDSSILMRRKNSWWSVLSEEDRNTN